MPPQRRGCGRAPTAAPVRRALPGREATSLGLSASRRPPFQRRPHQAGAPAGAFLEKQLAVRNAKDLLPLPGSNEEWSDCLHDCSSTIITPQFESATSVGFQRECQKCPNFKDSRLMVERSRRATACKFLPLEFENARRSPCAGEILRCPVDCCGQAGCFAEVHPNQPTCTSISPTVDGSGAFLEDSSQCPLPLYVDPLAFSPPDICTVEHPFSFNACSEYLPHVNSCSPDPQRSFALGDHSYGGDVTLVQDTPEHEYGVRVTWRRRSLLMKYLREKGVLSIGDTFVQME